MAILSFLLAKKKRSPYNAHPLTRSQRQADEELGLSEIKNFKKDLDE
ncbi:MAG: hypothetical protein J6572_09795 [Gilliamella sp.]|nr:hypothetical protein [Gilliamella sp.]